MNRVILAGCSPGEVRVAVCADGVLEDYAIWRPGCPDGVGDIHRGRVLARVPAMAGAFVAIADAEGFLPDSAGGAALTDGDAVMVRIVRAPQGGKGPRLAVEPGALPPGDGPALLHRGPGALERVAASYPDATIRIDDPGVIARLPKPLRPRIVAAVDAIDASVADQIEALAAPACPLPGGARLHISPTPALTALDVDLGAATGARARKAAAQLAANVAVIPEVTRQIRLRNLGGAIVVDFGGMSVRRRPALRPALDAALAADPLAPRCLGFTALGLAEIVRPRVHPPLHELLASPHAAALAALRACERALRADPARPTRLAAAPAIAAALDRDAAALADYARRTGQELAVKADPSLAAVAPQEWRIVS